MSQPLDELSVAIDAKEATALMTRVVSPGQLGAFAAKQPLHQFGPTSRSVIHRDSVNEQDGAPSCMIISYFCSDRHVYDAGLIWPVACPFTN